MTTSVSVPAEVHEDLMLMAHAHDYIRRAARSRRGADPVNAAWHLGQAAICRKALADHRRKMADDGWWRLPGRGTAWMPPHAGTFVAEDAYRRHLAGEGPTRSSRADQPEMPDWERELLGL